MPHAEDFTQIIAGRPIILYAVRDNLLNSVTQAGAHGISKMIDFEITPVIRMDGQGKPYQDGRLVKIKFEGMQTTYKAVKRAILLAQTLQTIVAQFGTDNYNFVKPYDLGCEVTIDVTATDITITYEYQGKLTEAEWATCIGAAASATTGNTGGTYVTGLTKEVFDETEYGAPGFSGIYVGTTGDIAIDDELGLKEAAGTKFQIKIAKQHETLKLQAISNKIEIKNTVSILENRVAGLVRSNAWDNTSLYVTWVFKNGMTIVLYKCTLLTNGLKAGDGSGLITYTNEGSSFLDPVNGAATNVVFTDGSSKIQINQQGQV